MRQGLPTTAMSGKVSLTIEDRTFEYAKLQGVKCKWLFAEKGFRRTKVPMPPNPTEEDWREVLRTTTPHPYDAALNQFTFVPQCGACILTARRHASKRPLKGIKKKRGFAQAGRCKLSRRNPVYGEP